jgi:GNAT superfamily N-acetyltransferase
MLRALAHSDPQRRGFSTYRWIVSCLEQLGETSIVLCRVDGEAAGICCVTVANGAAVVHTLYVDEPYRGRGVGPMLLEAVKNHAGDVPVHALALPGDRNTKNLLERAGMPAQLIVM